MSLMGTLAKVAVGVAVAKGASAMMNRSRTGGTAGTGGLFGGANSPNAGSLGGLLGGAGGSGGLGGLMEQLASRGGSAAGSARGSLDQLIGGLTGGAAAGGLGGLLGGLASKTGTAQPQQRGSFPDMLNKAFMNEGEPPAPPTPEQDAVAGLMLRAMIQAAKADGKIDVGEQQKLMSKLSDISVEEKAFVEQQMAAPVDPEALARDVPNGLGPQVYAMALMAIDLDNQKEAEFLHRLAEGLGIAKADVNAIHGEMGAPALYA